MPLIRNTLNFKVTNVLLFIVISKCQNKEIGLKAVDTSSLKTKYWPCVALLIAANTHTLLTTATTHGSI